MNNRWVMHTVVNLLVLLLFLAIPYLFPVCTDMITTAAGGTVPMKCRWCMRAELALGIPLMVMVASQFFLKNYAARQLSAFFLLPLGVMVILVPQDILIGVCKNSSMPCNTSKLAWMVLGGVLMVNALFQIRLSAQQRKYSL